MKGTIAILGLLAGLMWIAGCSLSTSEGTTVPSTPSAQDITRFQRVFMSSYFAERGGAPIQRP